MRSRLNGKRKVKGKTDRKDANAIQQKMKLGETTGRYDKDEM